ncbi:small-conductance mechanosensitive channel [Luteimonas sp. RC10]|nr:mechanosensitive ion channel family protein [Luteimonas sp. RC10]MBB3343847.1 small-conductance mechanosensitive channel [Luteimonas sp. RC10]
MTDRLPPWLHEWLDIVVPGGQILLILLAAWLLRLLGRRLLDRVGRRYTLPPEAVVGARRVMTFLIYAAALLLALERMGVSGTVLWTAFTGFAAVGAVAFFAAWSVLSNIFCTMLILTTRPFRLYDHVELLENGEKPGLRGQVVDINLVYTTLRETDDGDGAGTVLQVPNSLFFQRALRRWRGGALPEPKGVGAKRGDPLDV